MARSTDAGPGAHALNVGPIVPILSVVGCTSIVPLPLLQPVSTAIRMATGASIATAWMCQS